jgi:short subunit dehydrogenase-like uncharacterized protein
MTDRTWMLYGANGYTGRLTADEAVKRGAHALLAGRNAAEIEKLANRTGLPARIFALDSIDQIAGQLSGITALLNCAGPFSKTAPMLMEVCLRAKVHYLDITGEIDVIELAASLDARAREAGITLIPAVGFDVVPSDCLAAILAEKLPTATHLILAFTANGALSPGTTKTLLEALPSGGRARIDGQIRRVPADWKKRAIPFPSGIKEAVTIPWGDVSSAYYSTGIPNIETYLAASPALARQSNLLRRLSGLLRFRAFRQLAERWIGWSVSGPAATERAESRAELWGQVSDAAGNVAEATLETPNGYTLTVISALAAVERVVTGGVPSGFLTPSEAFGKDFVLTIPGTRLRD